MSLKFHHGGYNWALREGGPPMGCRERGERTFEDALKAAHEPLTRMSPRQLASWVVARLNAIVDGLLELEGGMFSHDTNEFGYKLKVSDEKGITLAYGAVVFQPDRMSFAWRDNGLSDFQAAFVALLTESPSELRRCEIVVRVPETKQTRSYGWDGYSLIT